MNTDCLAAQAFSNLDEVNTVAIHFWRIDIVERKLDTVIQIIESQLSLTNQAKVRVVNQNMDVRQVEVSAHGQLFNHELEVKVTGQGHDVCIRQSGTNTQRSRNCPAKRTCLTAVDPAAWLLDFQVLCSADLGQTDSGNVVNVLTEEIVHFLINALWFHRNVIIIGTTQHGTFALQTFSTPCGPIFQLAGSFPFLRNFNEQFQSGFCIGNNGIIRTENLAQLGRFDIDVNKLAALGIGIHAAGMTVCPAVTDTHDEIRCQEIGIAITMVGLETDHTGHQIVIVRNGTPPHQGWNNRRSEKLGQFNQQWGSVSQNDTTTSDQQRFFSVVQHGQRFFDLGAGCFWWMDFQRSVGIGIEFDFTHLDIQRKIDQYRTLTTGTHQIESLLQSPRNQSRFTDGNSHFGDWSGDFFNVYGLEIFLEKLGARSLTGNGQNRGRVSLCRIQTGNHIGRSGAGRTHTDTDITLFGTGITFRHVSDTFTMTSQDMFHGATFFHRRIKRIDTSAGNTEQLGYAFFFQYTDSRFGCGHFCHEAPPGSTIQIY